jgi:hypothetical protein
VIAGRPVVLVAGYELEPEVQAEIEIAGALVIYLRQRDPALVVRHIRHALLNLPPVPVPRSRIDSRPVAFRQQARTGPTIGCHVCGNAADLWAGSGPHAARANCHCGVWRWVSRAELQRAGIDASTLESPSGRQGLRGGQL